MALARVLARGQITLPLEVRQSAGIRPGDLNAFSVSGPGRVELRVLPRLRPTEALDRYHIAGPIAAERGREEWQHTAAHDVCG